MARGGARPGAGRPKDSKDGQTLVKEAALLRIRERVLAEIDPIMDALLKKARGADVQAIKEVFDRAFGKSPQSIDHTTKGKELPTPILGAVKDNDETN